MIAKAGPRPFSQRDFRDALSLFPTGVAIITSAMADGVLLGATVSSFSSVSLDPPLILFSMSRSANAFSAWEAVENFAVNILSEGQSRESAQFARAMTDKWCGIEPLNDGNGSPLIPGALAWLQCSSYARYDGGDHVIFVGHVEAIRVAEGRPLLFFKGQYRQLDIERATLAAVDPTQRCAGDHALHHQSSR